MSDPNVTSHHVPDLDEYKVFLRTIDGESDPVLRKLDETIGEHIGTPQEQTDWSKPEEWIEEFHASAGLSEAARDLALRLHEAGLNPRHWQLNAVRVARRDGTLDMTAAKTYVLTDYGRALSEGDSGAVDRYLSANGMYAILSFLRDEDGQLRENLYAPWQAWVNTAAGKSVKASSVLWAGVWTRLHRALIPLGYVKMEGVPRRYFLTPKGAAKATELKIQATGPQVQKEKRAHEVAVDDIIKVGDLLGYRTARTPKLRDLLPQAEKQNAQASVYDKKIDGSWTAELPMLGEIRVAIEVQDRGNIPDLVSRMKVIAPFCHYLIIISDEKQIADMQEFIAATGDEKSFKAKTVWVTPGQLHEVRQEVSHLSSVLTPAEQEDDPEADDEEELLSAADMD